MVNVKRSRELERAWFQKDLVALLSVNRCLGKEMWHHRPKKTPTPLVQMTQLLYRRRGTAVII